jgi:two-component system secretion response regulator SsrB
MASTRKTAVYRVLVADDHPHVLKTSALLKRMPRLKIVGTASDGNDALRKYLNLKPDLIIIDAEMPARSGVEAAKQIRRRDPDVKILFYSQRPALAEPALAAGGDGFLTKGAPALSLRSAIDSILNGGLYIERVLWPALQSRLRLREGPTPEFDEEELLVIPLLAQALTSKEIALRLQKDTRRIEKIRARLMRKLKAKNATSLVLKLFSISPSAGEPDRFRRREKKSAQR